MARWSGLAVLLVAMLFAGCIQGTPDTDPDGGVGGDSEGTGDVIADNSTMDDGDVDVEPAPLPPQAFNASDCNAVVLMAIDDYDAINDFLPAGFQPADVMSLLKSQESAYIGQGAIGPVSVQCGSNDLTGEPVGLVLPGTFVYTPELDGLNTSWVDGYDDFVAISDPVVADLFASYGWDVERNVTLDLTMDSLRSDDAADVDPFIPGAARGEVSATRDGEALFSGVVIGSATYFTHADTSLVTSPDPDTTDFIRFWHDTPAGLAYIESLVTEHGRSGEATCTFAGRYAETFGRTTCEPGESLGLVIADFELQTTLVRLDGIHA